MIDLSKFTDITCENLFVKDTVDDSGDRIYHEYTVMAQFKWGTQSLCGCISNPHDAVMFAKSPLMIKEIILLRAKVEELEKKIAGACDQLGKKGWSEAFDNLEEEKND